MESMKFPKRPKRDLRHKPFTSKSMYHELKKEDQEIRKQKGLSSKIGFWLLALLLFAGGYLFLDEIGWYDREKEETVRTAEEYKKILEDIHNKIPSEVKND